MSFKILRSFIMSMALFAISVSASFAACGVVFDSATTFTTGGGTATNATFAHTVNGANTLLLVQVAIQAIGATDTVNTVTYAGVTLTRAVSIQWNPTGTTVGSLETWYLVNPIPGTNNVFVQINDATGQVLHIGAISYQGVDQSTPIGAVTTVGQISAAAHSVTLTTTQANSLMVDMFGVFTTDGITVGTGQTQRWLEGADNPNNSTEGDELPTTTAGNYTMSYTVATAHSAAMAAVE